MVAISGGLALAGFFLPWVLVHYGMEVEPEIFGLKTELYVYFLLLDSSGYDLAFGHLSTRVEGEKVEVVGDALFLPFLILPVVFLAVPLAHHYLRARDRRATPVALAALAVALAAFFVFKMYVGLQDTVLHAASKRIEAWEAEKKEESFKAQAEQSFPRFEVGFWMTLFGYAGVLSGSIHWLREVEMKQKEEG